MIDLSRMMKQELPRTLKQLAVEVNVPVRELVQLYSRLGYNFPSKPSVKIGPEHIKIIIPLVEEYLSKPLPVSKRIKRKMTKKTKVSNKKSKAEGKKKMSKEVENEIMLSLDGFRSKVPKKSKKKPKFKPKKPVVIYTPMKS